MRKFTEGQILLTSRDGFISHAIRALDDCDVSHVATVYNNDYVVDARGDKLGQGVDKRSINALINESSIVYLGTPKHEDFGTVENRLKVQCLLKRQLYKKYDYFNTVLIQLTRIAGMFKIFQRNKKQAAKKWQCAELAISVANECYGFFPRWPKIAVSPKIVKESNDYSYTRIK